MAVEVVRDARTIVRICGEVDLSNVGELETALTCAMEESPRGFVLDASAVSYIDSTAIRFVLAAWQRMTDVGGAMALVPSEIVSRILDILGAGGLPKLLICETLEDAMDALSCCEGET